MLCPYVRSSSLSQFKFCQMRYTFEYLFGMPGKSGAKALKGTIFHKAQELRAQASKAIKAKRKSFKDDNFDKVTVANAIDIDWCLDISFKYYIDQNPELELTAKDKEEIRKWIVDTLTDYPHYDPLNLDIIQTEQRFDIEIKQPWAKYKGAVKGIEHEGNLAIRGTMDTIVRLDDHTYELVDYKTGGFRTDFATGEEKDLEYLKNDIQLLIYLIALKTLYPDKNWILTLFYIRVGGLFSVHGDDEMLERAYSKLEEMYTEISSCNNPTQFDPKNKDWRCKHLCPFSKPDSATRGQSLCQHYKGLIERKGMQIVQDSVINEKKLFIYSEGGGRSYVEK